MVRRQCSECFGNDSQSQDCCSPDGYAISMCGKYAAFTWMARRELRQFNGRASLEVCITVTYDTSMVR